MPRKSKIEATSSMLVKPELAKAIGYVATNWALLEATILSAIGQVLDLSIAANFILVSEVSFIQRLAIVSSLVHHSRRKDWFDLWDILIKRIEPLRDRRNNVIHGFWRSKQNVHTVLRIKSKGKLTYSKPEIKIEDVQKLYVDICQAAVDVDRFMQILQIEDFKESFLNPKGPVLDRTQSQQARALDRSRALKKSKRQTALGPKKGPQLSSAQKRALREAENHVEDKKT